jgi:hypothetical protein
MSPPIKKLLPPHKESCPKSQGREPGLFCILDEGHKGKCRPQELPQLELSKTELWQRRLR